jgi:hypothetical protein
MPCNGQKRTPTGSIETWRETTGYPRRMSVDPAFLAKISLFAPLDDDERAVLAQAMVDRQVKPGEVLFRAGRCSVAHRGHIDGQRITLCLQRRSPRP